MNQHSSSTKKYYPVLIGAALLAASLFQFSRPVFSAGTSAGQIIRNTATGTYKDNDDNTYTIDSNTVEVTVAKVAGITNIPSAFTDETSSATNTSVLTGDTVSFEFTITNVGNDTSNIHIPTVADIIAANGTKGLDTSTLSMTADLNGDGTFTAVTLDGDDNFIVPDVPANGQIVIKVTGEVSATAAGAPIEVLLGNTGSNTDPNEPVADTQNQFVDSTAANNADAADEVRTLNPTTATKDADNVDIPGLTYAEQKEASAKRQVFLGSNPLAATRILKTSVHETDPNATPPAPAENLNSNLQDNTITYSLGLEVLTTTPSSLNTPGKLEGRDFGTRVNVSTITDTSNLVLVSDAIPAGTTLKGAVSSFTENGRTWTPVYAIVEPASQLANSNLAADQISWGDAAALNLSTQADFATVKRVGWVYNVNANTPATGETLVNETRTIKPGASITGFTFDVTTSTLPTEGGAVANIAQVFGSTFDSNLDAAATGPDVFDESGDQDPSNFNGTVPGPKETSPGSTGIANPANHGVDSENNNNATSADPDSPGGEDNVVTIGAAGQLINGPDGQPAATGNALLLATAAPDNNHDFQNKGIDNFSSATTSGTASTSGNPQHGGGYTLNPNAVVFTNTLSNPGTTDLSDVLLQPINPSFGAFGADAATGGDDRRLPEGTKVTINLGTQQAIYTYSNGTVDNGVDDTATGGSFTLDATGSTAATLSQPITIPTLAAGVPLDYTVTIDLPSGTELSTDLDHGFAVPIIAFVDDDPGATVLPTDNNGTPDANENSNYTINQIYTGFVKITKGFEVIDPDNTPRATGADALPGDTIRYTVNYRNISEPQVGTGSNLVLEGTGVTIDENGTLDAVTAVTDGNNWALDTNLDGDLDTINIQGTARDSSANSVITFYTGATSPAETADLHSVGTLIPAGTTDPGDVVTGYRVVVPSVAPTAAGNPFQFIFERKVDEYDGLAQDIDNLPANFNPTPNP